MVEPTQFTKRTTGRQKYVALPSWTGGSVPVTVDREWFASYLPHVAGFDRTARAVHRLMLRAAASAGMGERDADAYIAAASNAERQMDA